MDKDAEILLVEDNEMDADLALLALKKNNLLHSVSVVRDGEEALQYLFCQGPFSNRDFVRPPRLVLLDLKLPKVNGLEVLRALKNDVRTRGIPVVVLTSSTEEKDVATCYQLGVNSYIQKAIDFTQYREIIRQVGTYWLLLNQQPPGSAFRS
jgi:CheY-like chemotaxis protein